MMIVMIVWKSQTQEAAETIVHSFVTSHIDYCNSILYGTSATHIRPCRTYLMLQRQDSFFVSESMTASLLQYVTHCTGYIPVQQRIEYKM